MGADLLVNVDAPAPDGESTSRRCLSARTKLWAATGRPGWFRLANMCSAAPAFRLDHPLQQGRRKGSAARRRAGGVGGELLAYRPVDQLRDDLLRSDPARRAARAALLVYQSSTSTFQGSWAQPQLAAQPAVRAVEAGIPAVHASLSGDSSAFDTRGRRLAWCSAEFNGAIVVNVPLASNVTLYLRLGDWVPVTAFVVMGAGFAVFLRRSLARVSDCADK